MAKTSILVTQRPDRQAWYEAFCRPSLEHQAHSIIYEDPGPDHPCAKRNRLISQSATPYYYICDDDLILPRDHIYSLVCALEATPGAAFAYSDYTAFSVPPAMHPMGPVHRLRSGPWDPGRLTTGNYISACSLFRREAAKDIPWDANLAIWQDWDLWLRYAQAGLEGVYVAQTAFFAFTLDSSLSTEYKVRSRSFYRKWPKLKPGRPRRPENRVPGR